MKKVIPLILAFGVGYIVAMKFPGLLPMPSGA